MNLNIDNEEHITIYSAYDNSTALPKAKYDSFMDSFFLAGLGFKAPGTFPLVIRSSDTRYNSFQNSGYEEKHAFSCAGTPKHDMNPIHDKTHVGMSSTM